jgi:5-methylcytosine-specific restriction enzyme A
MIEEQFGSSDAYFSIFKALQRDGIFDRQFALLQAHYDAPNHIVTWAQLAGIVGYANGSAVNLQYGMLAKRVAHRLGYTEPPQGFWLFVLVDWVEDMDPNGHTSYVLRRPVIEALTRLGIISREKTLNYWVVRGKPDQNGDFDFIKQGESDEWRTKRPPSKKWKIGDRLFVWASSPRLELISLGEFLGETGKYTSDNEFIYRVRYLTPLVSRPLSLAKLRADNALKKAIFLKVGPAMSVVKLSEDEGEHLYRLFVSDNPTISGTWPELETSDSVHPDIDDFAVKGERRLVHHFQSGFTEEAVMGAYPFKVGAQYTRHEVFDVLGIPDPGGGNWYTGYTAHGDDWFIFCGVGTPGRTGHDYHNYFRGDELVWYGKNGSRLNQPSIQGLLRPSANVYIFYRDDDRSPFTFAGLARAKEANNVSPVEVVWSFATDGPAHPEILPEEIAEPDKVFEGAKKSVTVNIYERDQNARRKCIEHWGIACIVCGFNFLARYGELGDGFIHVHHLKPLAEIGERYELNPISDLRPVCPNCHAMLHRESPALSIDELRARIRAPA